MEREIARNYGSIQPSREGTHGDNGFLVDHGYQPLGSQPNGNQPNGYQPNGYQPILDEEASITSDIEFKGKFLLLLKD